MFALLASHAGGLDLLGNLAIASLWHMALSSANRWFIGLLHLTLIARNEKGELRSRVAEYLMGRVLT